MKKHLLFFAILIWTLISVSSSAQPPNSWTQEANLAGGAREAAVGFSIGGKGFIGTGMNGVCRNDFWEYDPNTNTWTQKANFGGAPRWRAIGFSIGSKGYIGIGGNGSTFFSDFWEYDTTSNSWTQKANFGGPQRMDAVGFSIGTKGYIGTGLTSNAASVNVFWEYDPGNNTWTQKANFGGTPRFGASGFVMGSYGFIGCGEGDLNNFMNDVWKYDPASNSWTQIANFGGSPRVWAIGFSIGTKGYIGTGSGLTSLYNDFWEYDPNVNNWTQKANFGGSPRFCAVGFCIGNKGYIGTGSSNILNYTSDFWQYTPSCILPSPPANTTPSANQNICIGNSTTLSASGTGTLGWYTAATGGTWLGGGSNFTTPILTSDTTYYVQDSTCGPSLTRTSIPVTVNLLPVPTITGQTGMCVNSGYYNYSTEPGMQNYLWTVSSGGIITYGSGTNQIQVSWINPGPQTVSVTYSNGPGCEASQPTVLNVTVNPLPGQAGIITGTDNVCAGDNGIAYSIAPIPNTITYVWTLPPNAAIASGAGTDSITVNFASNATSGNISVYSNNLCGDGPVSPNLFVTVTPIPITPVITNTGDTLHSSSPTGNQWYFEGNIIPGATSLDFLATQEGYYWDIVTINSCSSDTSNHKLILLTGMETYSSSTINIYPVPNEGRFNVTINTTKPESFTVNIYSTLGVKIYEEKNVEVNGSLGKMIDLRPVPDGVYTIVFKNRYTEVVRKIVVKKD